MTKFSGPKLYGIVTVGERGQVVIPTGLRKLFGINAGDKLFVLAKEREMIALAPVDKFNEFLNHMTEMAAKIKKTGLK